MRYLFFTCVFPISNTFTSTPLLVKGKYCTFIVLNTLVTSNFDHCYKTCINHFSPILYFDYLKIAATSPDILTNISSWWIIYLHANTFVLLLKHILNDRLVLVLEYFYINELLLILMLQMWVVLPPLMHCRHVHRQTVSSTCFSNHVVKTSPWIV